MASKLVELILSLNAQGFVSGADQSRAAVSKLSKELNGIQSAAGAALSFAGIGLGTAELIKVADAYGQMTGKLKLATQYSGDYAEVQTLLRDSARETRSDLGGTVDLYTKMSPALKGIGMNAQQSIGIITTINKAIGMSGASAEAAKAALVQLGQGFGSGVLRGEELNSVMEQTPMLARAIADGLGVPIGALRKMGEEGKLTAEAVATALQKVADQVDADFAQMPITVGQAMTALRNEFMVFVGATDDASGGTSALAGVILAVADEFRSAGPAVTAFSTAIKIMIDGLDGAYRILKILGTGLAAYAAMATEALKGNFSGVKAIWADLGTQIDGILQKPLVGQAKAIDASANAARQRLRLEQQLAEQTTKLEQLKAYEAGTASDNVAAKDKANIDARIADQKRLVDAVRKAWQDSLAEAEKYANSAKEKLQKATDFRDAGKNAAFNAGLKGMSEEDQLAAKQQRMSDLQGQGSYEAARARMAALEGDIKKYDGAAAAAEKRLKEALQLAQDIGDIGNIEGISNELAKVQESGAALDNKKATEAQAKGAEQAKMLNDLQAQLDDMQKKARSIEVKADISAAESSVKGLKAQLDELKDKTVTVTVNTVGSPAALAAGKANAAAEATNPTGFASGGYTGAGSKYQPAGIVHAEEFVHRREVVRQPGALAFLEDFNRRGMAALRGYADGGLVGRIFSPSLSAPNGDSVSGTRSVVNLAIDGKRFAMSAADDVVGQLTKHVQREALRKGSRR